MTSALVDVTTLIYERVQTRLAAIGVSSATPRQFARELLRLNEEHYQTTGHVLPLDGMRDAMWRFAPPSER